GELKRAGEVYSIVQTMKDSLKKADQETKTDAESIFLRALGSYDAGAPIEFVQLHVGLGIGRSAGDMSAGGMSGALGTYSSEKKSPEDQKAFEEVQQKANVYLQLGSRRKQLEDKMGKAPADQKQMYADAISSITKLQGDLFTGQPKPEIIQGAIAQSSMLIGGDDLASAFVS